MKPEDFNYVVKNNMCLFQKGPLSNWWGGFPNQNGGFYLEYYKLVDHKDSKLVNWLLSWNPNYDDIQYNCVEQFMMAKKASLFGDIKTLDKIMKTTHPAEQKKLGREVVGFQPEVWDTIKYDVVGEAVDAKFDRNYDLQVFLKQFHPQTIFAEAVTYDKIWGTGLDKDDPLSLDIYNWPGQNLLGRIIGDVRRQYEQVFP